jgi:2OG-Fe(II) oxygenase superfamily
MSGPSSQKCPNSQNDSPGRRRDQSRKLSSADDDVRSTCRSGRGQRSNGTSRRLLASVSRCGECRRNRSTPCRRVVLTATGPGGLHRRHADNSRQNEHGDWVANHTHQRDVSAIHYLNDAFEGGEIVFELQQLVVKPGRGPLLAVPSDADHVHEVLPVRSGVRYSMPIWFTKQQGFALVDLRSAHR